MGEVCGRGEKKKKKKKGEKVEIMRRFIK